MHDAAMQFVTRWAPAAGTQPRVIEIGSADRNGQVRGLWPDAAWYVGLDVASAPGVDVVLADVTAYDPPDHADLVVCCETLEHAENWPSLVRSAADWLTADGVFLVTCAGPDRKPHAADGSRGGPPPGEWYANIEPASLSAVMRDVFAHTLVEQVGLDVRAVGWME